MAAKQRVFQLVMQLLLTAVNAGSWSIAEECFFKQNSGDTPVELNNSVLLGGVYDVHSYGNNYAHCEGELFPDGAVETEAHLFALDYVNRRLLPDAGKSFRLLTHVQQLVDSCNSAAVGLQNSIEFIGRKEHNECTPGFPTKFLNALMTEGVKNADDCSQHRLETHTVVGSFNSDTARNLNILLQSFCIPAVGAGATASSLSSTYQYPYYFRTVPSDRYLVKAMFDTLLRRLGWTHVFVIYENTVYGLDLVHEFRLEMAQQSNNKPLRSDANPLPEPSAQDVLCVDKYIEMTTERLNESYWNYLKQYMQEVDSPRVAVVFMTTVNSKILLDHVLNWPLNDSFQFVFTATGLWQETNFFQESTFFPNPRPFHSALSFGPAGEVVASFEEHLKELTINATMNPYIIELMQQQNNCCYAKMAGTCDRRGHGICDDATKLQLPLPRTGLLGGTFVLQAVLLVANGLLRMQEEYCPNEPELCENFHDQFTGISLADYVRNVTLHDTLVGFEFFTNSNGPKPLYNVYCTNASANNSWTYIGRYDVSSGNAKATWLRHPEEMLLTGDQYNTSSQRCRPACEMGVKLQIKSCCIRCQKCKSYEIANQTTKECQQCPAGQMVDENTNYSCKEIIPINILFYGGFPPWPVVTLLGMMYAGVIATLCITSLIVQFFTTPLVKAVMPDLLLARTALLVVLFLSPVLLFADGEPVPNTIFYWLSSTTLAACHAVSIVGGLRVGRPGWYVKLVSGNHRRLHLHKRCSADTVDGERCARLLFSIVVTVGLTFVQGLLALVWLVLKPLEVRVTECGVTHPGEFCRVWSANEDWQTLMLLVLPITYLVVAMWVLRLALRNMYVFHVRQTRLAIAGCFCQLVVYFMTLVFTPGSSIYGRKVMVIYLPIVIGVISWFTYFFTIAYVIIFKRDSNSVAFLRRERPRTFQQGNTMFFIDCITLNPRLDIDLQEVNVQPSPPTPQSVASVDHSQLPQPTTSSIGNSNRLSRFTLKEASVIQSTEQQQHPRINRQLTQRPKYSVDLSAIDVASLRRRAFSLNTMTSGEAFADHK